MMRRGLVLLLLAFVVSHAFAQTDPPPRLEAVLYVERVPPDTQWVRIYREVEQCVGLKGDVVSVSWYVTEHAVAGDSGTRMHSKPTIDETRGWWRIRWNGVRQLIVIRGDTATIKHEILHDVLWSAGLRPNGIDPAQWHPPAFFGPGKCAQREE